MCIVFRVFSAIHEYNLKLLVDIHYRSFFVIGGKFSLARMKTVSHSVIQYTQTYDLYFIFRREPM
jgi:hypothetical protein